MSKIICPFCKISNYTELNDNLKKCESCGKVFKAKAEEKKTEQKANRQRGC